MFQEREECSGSDSILLQTLYIGGVESKQVILEGDTEFSGKDQISVRVTGCRDLENVENVHFLSLCVHCSFLLKIKKKVKKKREIKKCTFYCKLPVF